MDVPPSRSISAGDISTAEVSYEYSGLPLQVVTIVFLVLSTLFLGLRFFSRLYVKKIRLGWDDIWVVCGFMCIIGISVSVLVSLRAGLGHHQLAANTLYPHLIPLRGALCLYAIPILYCLASAFPRLSILALYLRIFTPHHHPIPHYTCYFITLIVLATAIVNSFTIGFQCRPVSAAWDPSAPPGSCDNIWLHYAWGTLPNIVTDVVLLALPVPNVWRMGKGLGGVRVGGGVKGGLAVVFALGGMGAIASTLRFIEFLQTDFESDASWLSVPLYIWTVVEPATYHISACLVACRPVLAAIAQSKAWKRLGRGKAKESLGSDESGRFFFEENNRKAKKAMGREGLGPWSGDEVGLGTQYSGESSIRRFDGGSQENLIEPPTPTWRRNEAEEVAARVASFR